MLLRIDAEDVHVVAQDEKNVRGDEDYDANEAGNTYYTAGEASDQRDDVACPRDAMCDCFSGETCGSLRLRVTLALHRSFEASVARRRRSVGQAQNNSPPPQNFFYLLSQAALWVLSPVVLSQKSLWVLSKTLVPNDLPLMVDRASDPENDRSFILVARKLQCVCALCVHATHRIRSSADRNSTLVGSPYWGVQVCSVNDFATANAGAPRMMLPSEVPAGSRRSGPLASDHPQAEVTEGSPPPIAPSVFKLPTHDEVLRSAELILVTPPID